MLFWFRIRAKLWAHTLKASLPCLPLPLHRTSPSPQPLQKNNNPSPRTKLASLVKGRWIDGKAQTVVLLRFTCDTPAFFIHQTFCRQDGGIATPPSLAPHQPFIKPHYPSLCAITLASPRKRGGGTAVEVLRLAVQYSDSPAFTILKLFRAVTVGIVPHPHHQ